MTRMFFLGFVEVVVSLGIRVVFLNSVIDYLKLFSFGLVSSLFAIISTLLFTL